MKRRSSAIPMAVQACHECLSWMIPLPDSFPRVRRFTLGERIETLALAILEARVEDSFSRQDKGVPIPGPRHPISPFSERLMPGYPLANGKRHLPGRFFGGNLTNSGSKPRAVDLPDLFPVAIGRIQNSDHGLKTVNGRHHTGRDHGRCGNEIGNPVVSGRDEQALADREIPSGKSRRLISS